MLQLQNRKTKSFLYLGKSAKSKERVFLAWSSESSPARHSSTVSLTRESPSIPIKKKKIIGGTRSGKEEKRSRKTASGRSWPNFSRGTFWTISLSRFPPVEEDRALVDRHTVIRTWSYTINTREGKSGYSSRCSHEAEDTILLPSRSPRIANHRHHRRGSATDNDATASRRRPRAIELCIMPNALDKQYDRLEWRGGSGRPRGRMAMRSREGNDRRRLSMVDDSRDFMIRYIEGESEEEGGEPVTSRSWLAAFVR